VIELIECRSTSSFPGLTFAEFEQAAKQFNKKELSFEEKFALIDIYEKGSISLEEFIQSINDCGLQERLVEPIEVIFNRIDVENRGYLTINSLKSIIK